MARVYKSLGQVAPVAAVLTTLYTVPALTQAILSSITVANRGGTTAKFRVAHAVAGAADDVKQYLAWDIACPAGESYIFTIGVTLAAADVVRALSDTGLCTFNAHGSEIT